MEESLPFLVLLVLDGGLLYELFTSDAAADRVSTTVRDQQWCILGPVLVILIIELHAAQEWTGETFKVNVSIAKRVGCGPFLHRLVAADFFGRNAGNVRAVREVMKHARGEPDKPAGWGLRDG